MNNSWQDQDAAWYAKAQRARKHIGEIRAMATEFYAARPYRINVEETDGPLKIALRFRVLTPVPVDMLTAIGDALHNMRSSLDSVAYELARRHLGGTMAENQKAATAFPLREDREAFDEFLARRSQRDLYGKHEQNALRSVQPFAIRERAAEHGVDLRTSAQTEYMINPLVRLSQLNNRDKHRYLPLLKWYLEFLYLGGDLPETRFALRMHQFLKDGDLIGHIEFDEPVQNLGSLIHADVRLAFADDPGYVADFLGSLSSWHDSLITWNLPMVFTVADGNPPPLGFFNIG